jgi:S-DNA-T family DNA segregation ATPase FtsK/SpoIIIE
MGGAEKLLGKGDMLYYPVGASKPKRAQGAFMSDEEVEALVAYIKSQEHEVTYNEEILDDVQSFGTNLEDVDEYLEEAIAFVVETGQASASLMQRRFRVGYNRAARLVDAMEERGIIGPTRGSKPREVLISVEEYHAINGREDIEHTFESEPESAAYELEEF